MLLLLKNSKNITRFHTKIFSINIPSKKETLDIDTIEDFKLAQKYVKFKNK